MPPAGATTGKLAPANGKLAASEREDRRGGTKGKRGCAGGGEGEGAVAAFWLKSAGC